jgi:hypothetical protein
MDSSRPAEAPSPTPDTLEFVRFCYRRHRVGWPELYDEMCAVAGRGLYRGWRFAELESHGIGFSLDQTLELARIAGQVAAEEGDRRGRGVAKGVVGTDVEPSRDGSAATESAEPDRIAVVAGRSEEHSFDVRIVTAAQPLESTTEPSGTTTALAARVGEAPVDPIPLRVAVPMDASGAGRLGSGSPGTVLVPSLVRRAAIAG